MPRQKSQHVDNPRAVGERLKAAREAAGLSQRQLSFSGCSPAYISRIESGDRIPSLQLLRELGRRLGVSEDFLATGVDASRPARKRSQRPSSHADSTTRTRRGRSTRRYSIPRPTRASERTPSGSRPARAAGRACLGRRLALFEQALAASDQSGPSTDPSLAEGLGRAQAALGDLDSALEIYERSLADAESKREPLEQSCGSERCSPRSWRTRAT